MATEWNERGYRSVRNRYGISEVLAISLPVDVLAM